MTEEEFQQLVREAVAALPEAGKKALENVAFFVEPGVRRETAEEIRLERGHTLLGLYQGVSKLNRGPGYSGALPDRITIFQRPIEAMAGGDPAKVKEIVFDVVRHEVGHHLGFDEAGIRAYERARKARPKEL